MNLHKCIVHPGIRTSDKLGRCNFFQRDLFYGLLSAAHKGGWFENNAGALRAALFAPCLGKVSERDVKDGLLKLREVGVIKLWTGRNGRAYGAVINYRQRFDYGEELPAEGEPPGDDELFRELLQQPPPPDPPIIQNRIEVSGKGRAAPDTPTTSDNEWLDELVRTHAGIDVRAEFKKATKRYPLGFGRKFFEGEWLTKAEAPIKLNGNLTAAAVIEPEPKEWRTRLENLFPGNLINAEQRPWAAVPAEIRAEILKP